MHPTPLTLWVERGLMRRLAREADGAQPDETGGVLLGWRSGDDVVARLVVDAGPRAERWPTGMRPDAEYQAAEIAAAFEATDGAVTYLGDWHSHPGTTPSPSRRDRKTLRNIAADADAQCPEPIMLIIAGGEPAWEAGAWTGRLGRLGRWGPVSVREVSIRLFDAGHRS
jgi:integrative and conjugative element protein (TIGR02256 family)